jgi:hypothetical protein
MDRYDIIKYLANMQDFKPNYLKEQYQEYLASFDTETLKDKLDRQNAWLIYKQEAEFIGCKAVGISGAYLKVGAVIKIDTLTFEGRDYYNWWACVLKIHKETEEKQAIVEIYIEDGTKCNLAVKNIKSIIGTEELDIVGLGKERHKKEVVTFIKRAFRVKIKKHFN